jgi:hypothetical protein
MKDSMPRKHTGGKTVLDGESGNAGWVDIRKQMMTESEVKGEVKRMIQK